MSWQLHLERGAWSGLVAIKALLVFGILTFALPVYAVENIVEVEGVVRPLHRIKLNSQLTGRIKGISTKEGALVKKGDILIELDDSLQRAAVEKATLQVQDIARSKTASFRLLEARAVLDQMKSAFQKEAAAEWEVRRAELQVNLAKMEVKVEAEEKAKNEVLLGAEKERLAMHLIKAPIDGTVRKILAEPGQTVSASEPVVELVDLSSLKAEFFLPISWYDKLQAGKDYVIRAGEPVNQMLTVKLETADRALDSASQTFRAVFQLSNPHSSLPSGFQVSFPLETAQQNQ